MKTRCPGPLDDGDEDFYEKREQILGEGRLEVKKGRAGKRWPKFLTEPDERGNEPSLFGLKKSKQDDVGLPHRYDNPVVIGGRL
jgi:hypothetical protein